MLNKPFGETPENLNESDEAVFEVNVPKEESRLSEEEKDAFSEKVSEEFPYIKKVVGIKDKSDEEFFLAKLSEANARGAKPEEGEFEKTKKEIEMIALAKNGADDILLEFGGADLYDIALKRIHVVGENKDIHGLWDWQENKIDLPRQKSSVDFVMNAFHEIAHSKMYIALQIFQDENKKEIGSYRNGLKVISRDGKEGYMDIANEAAQYELEKMFFDKYVRDNPSFSEEEKINRTDTIASGGYLGADSNSYLRDFIRNFSEKILEGIRRLPEGEKYKNAKDIKSLMIRSAISGDVLELGRLIKKVFGSVKPLEE